MSVSWLCISCLHDGVSLTHTVPLMRYTETIPVDFFTPQDESYSECMCKAAGTHSTPVAINPQGGRADRNWSGGGGGGVGQRFVKGSVLVLLDGMSSGVRSICLHLGNDASGTAIAPCSSRRVPMRSSRPAPQPQCNPPALVDSIALCKLGLSGAGCPTPLWGRRSRWACMARGATADAPSPRGPTPEHTRLAASGTPGVVDHVPEKFHDGREVQNHLAESVKIWSCGDSDASTGCFVAALASELLPALPRLC